MMKKNNETYQIINQQIILLGMPLKLFLIVAILLFAFFMILMWLQFSGVIIGILLTIISISSFILMRKWTKIDRRWMEMILAALKQKAISQLMQKIFRSKRINNRLFYVRRCK